MQPADCLERAKAAVCKDRNEVYGDAKDDFSRTAVMWSAILNQPITNEQVAMCMIAVKLSRLCESPDHEDGWVDIAGYAACGGYVSEPPGD